MSKLSRLDSNPPAEGVEGFSQKSSPETHQEEQAANPESSHFTIAERQTFHSSDGTERHPMCLGVSDGVGVLAFESGQVLATTTTEQAVRAEMEKEHTSLEASFDRAIDAVMASSGMVNNERARVKARLHERRVELLMEASLEDNPSETLIQIVRETIERNEQHRSAEITQYEKNLSLKQSELQQARARADVAEKAEDEKSYKEAMREVYLYEGAIMEFKKRLDVLRAVETSPKEQEERTLEIQGAVIPTPDELYDVGIDAVRDRVKELEQSMQTADQAHDEVAWLVARNEYNHHRVMMPILEQAHQLEEIDLDLEGLKAISLGRQEQDKLFKQARTRVKMIQWRNITAGTMEKMEEIKIRLDAMPKIRAQYEGSIREEIFQEEETRLKSEGMKIAAEWKEALKMTQQMAQAHEKLKNAGVELVFDEEMNEKASEQGEKEKGLFSTLQDLYVVHPERVRTSLERLINSTTTRDVTKALLKRFLENLNTPDVVEQISVEPSEKKADESLPELPPDEISSVQIDADFQKEINDTEKRAKLPPPPKLPAYAAGPTSAALPKKNVAAKLWSGLKGWFTGK